MRRAMVIGLLACAAWATCAEAQWGPGGGGGGRRGGDRGRFEEVRGRMEALSAFNVEAMWAVLCFGLRLAPEQLDSLRGAFGESWNRRASVLAMAEKADNPDWGAYRDELRDMKKELEQKIKAVLNEEHQKEYSKEMKAYENPRLRGGGPGFREGG